MSSFLVKLFLEPSVSFSILGKAAVGCLAYAILSKVYQLIKLYLLQSAVNLKKYGKWAVVTGATDGIGKAYAMQLASKGLDVVLISRTNSKLEATAKEIKSKYQDVEVKCIEADFSNSSIYSHIQKGLEGLDIGVLVNNVGVSYDHPQYFLELSDKDIQNLVTVNINSVLSMTKMVLDRMVEKRGGVIINVASMSSFIPVPLLTVYGASKAFVRSFSMSLNFEYKSKGIIVQCVSPGLVATKLSKVSRTRFFVPSPEELAKSALNTIGSHNDLTGSLGHELQATALAVAGSNYAGNHFIKMVLRAKKKHEKQLKGDQKAKDQ